MKQEKIAKKIKDLEDWVGNATLYKLALPLEGHKFVVVSAVVAPFTGAETYIFGANKFGEIKDFLELDGSFRGELNHEKALNNAGYILKD